MSHLASRASLSPAAGFSLVAVYAFLLTGMCIQAGSPFCSGGKPLLPSGSTLKVITADETVRITISAHGALDVDGIPVIASGLPAAINARLRGRDIPVLIAADQRLGFGAIKAVIRTLDANGIRDCTFLGDRDHWLAVSE